MPDPLSIGSGIAGFLSLGIQVTQSLVAFYSAYKDQDVELSKITQNLDNLHGIFESLDVAIQDCQFRSDAQELFREVEKAVDRCDEIVKELQTECEKFHKDPVRGFKGRIQVAGRRVSYPFRKSTLQKLEEDAGEIREILSFALDVLQLKSHNQIQDGISELRSLIERTNAHQLSLTIHAWLKAPEVFSDHNAACAKRHEDTGLWFINSHEFKNWLMTRSSFLWINGFAGCGKSVLCSTIIQHTFRQMKQRNGVGIAFFYFSFNEKSKQDDAGMLRALLLQLSGQLRDGQTELENLHALHQLGPPPVDVLLELLQHFLGQFCDSYIVLDALDESPRDYKREGVLKAIQVMRSWSLPGVHILVTSRNELDILESLRPSSDQNIPMKNSEIDRDIVEFVSYQLRNDPKLQRWRSRHEEIQTILTTRAQGVYVDCQFNALRRARNRIQLDECLRTLPRDLDETYERILGNINEEYIEDVRRVLAILCFSTRPLTVEELIDAHAVDLSELPHLDRDGRSYEQDDLVDICLGLIEVVPMKDGKGKIVAIARVAHFSVKEYLQSHRILKQGTGRFAIRSETAHTEIAQIYLVYLMEPSLSSGILEKATLREFPLAHLAAMQWHYHYQNAQQEKQKLDQLVLKLFQNRSQSFATWVRLHDMDRPWNSVNYNRLIDDIPSPLYYAALLGLDSVLNNLMNSDSEDTVNTGKVKSQGQHGNPLQAASWAGHEKVVQMLLARGFNVNAKCRHRGTALQAASLAGHEIIVRILLNHGADINAQAGSLLNITGSASRIGEVKWMQLLLHQAMEADILGGHFCIAIQIAASQGHGKVVRLLLDRGADINTESGCFGNALQAAAWGGNMKVVQMLLDESVDVNTQGGFYGNALQAASREGHIRVVKMLLDRGADINTESGCFGNSLQAAACSGNMKVVQMLLDEGADVNAKGGLYGSALQAASQEGHHIRVVQMLLDRGSDVNMQGGKYGNALQAASSKGHIQIVHMLLDQGADVNAKGGIFGSALEAAFRRNHTQVAQILQDAAIAIKVDTHI